MALSDNPVARYHRRSKNLANSLVLVLPLLVVYQLGVLASGGVRNGVDFLTDTMWWAAGGELQSYIWINAAILVAFAGATFLLRRRGTFRPGLWPKVILESSLYALFLGAAVLQIMGFIGVDSALNVGAEAGDSLLTILVLSIGAGVYEELVFRLILMGGLFVIGVRLLKWPALAAAAIAVVVSSLIFSAVHHIGALGDPFSPGVFVFRFVAGILLAVIFYLRGFAVAVYTHAIYDIIVLMSPG